jgi:hypothetical protein
LRPIYFSSSSDVGIPQARVELFINVHKKCQQSKDTELLPSG